MSLPPLSTVTLLSGTLAWREVGTGTALLCLHGLGSSSKSWEPQYRDLGGTFRVIGWDCPGYGGSDDPRSTTPPVVDYADALVGLLNSLSLDTVDLIGHSMGAIIAGCFAGLYANRVRRLILSGARAGSSRLGAAASGYAQRVEELRTLSPEEFGACRAAGMVAPDADAAVRERVARIAAEAR